MLLLGNPVIWWAGCLALVWGLVMWVGARDWRYGVALIGVATDLAALAAVRRPADLHLLRHRDAAVPGARPDARPRPDHRRDRGPSPRRTVGVIVAGSFVVLAMLTFAWFWPMWTDQLITRSEWLDRMWFHRWI